MLSLAGIASAAALLLASASLTVGIIAAACPPVSQYLDAAQNARVAAHTREALIPSALSLLVAMLAMFKVIQRRPIWFRAALWSPLPPSTFSLVLFGAATVVATAFVGVSIRDSIESVHLAGQRQLTDNLPFASFSLQLGGVAVLFGTLSQILFRRWWLEHEGPRALSPTGQVPSTLCR